jgi:uncharacterized cupin superfamily protein
MVEEAPLEEGPSGLVPAGEGWFVLNARDATWRRHDTFGASTRFESLEAPFDQLGVCLRVLQPGQPNGLYHREAGQEDFLVVAGECLLVVEGRERRLGPWDFVHCPPGTEHIFVGAGDGPCVLVMTGSRPVEHPFPEDIVYPRSELAASHGASAAVETCSPPEAYAPYGPTQHGRPAYWDELPWSGGPESA